MFIIVILFLIYDLYLLISRRFIAALTIFIIALPLIIAFIGMYIDNMTVMIIGLGSSVVIYPLFAIWAKRLSERDQNNLYNHKGRW